MPLDLNEPRQRTLIKFARRNPVDDSIVIRSTYDLGSCIDVAPDNLTSGASYFFGVLAILIAIALWFGHFARQETVKGVVSVRTGYTRLEAQRSGMVSGVFVKTGDRVTAGQTLLAIDLRQAVLQKLDTIDGEIERLTQRRSNTMAEERDRIERLQHLVPESTEIGRQTEGLLRGLDDQEAIARKALDAEHQRFAELSPLIKQQLVVAERLEGIRRAATEYEGQIAAIAVRRAEILRERLDREKAMEKRRVDEQRALMNLQNDLLETDSRLAEARAQRFEDVVAPRDGEITAIAADVGRSVHSGEFLVSIVNPAAEPMIVLDAPSRAIGLLQPGQSVVLKYEEFDFKAFGVKHGIIRAISSTPVSFRSLEQPTPNSRPSEPEALFRVDVQPDEWAIDVYGTPRTPSIGSTVTADVVVERRRIIDWLLDPIHAMQGRL